MVPSNPADAGALMLTAIKHDHPVLYFEHKMLSDYWLDAMGIGGRDTISFDLPAAGIEGQVPDQWVELDLGQARIWREGTDISLISLGMGVHHCLTVAKQLEQENISAEVIDLRFVAPLDRETLIESVQKTGKLVVVDEDYTQFGLTGEIAAVLAEHDIDYRFRRVGTDQTIPFDTRQEQQVLPNIDRIHQKIKEII
jgi:pyruvate dehydrogenase E1 component beta subunit